MSFPKAEFVEALKISGSKEVMISNSDLFSSYVVYL